LRRGQQREHGEEKSIDSEERGFCFHGDEREAQLAVVSLQLAGKKFGGF
jgi:hypothetical protein